MPDRVYWDACVFLSYINGEQERLPMIDALLEESRSGEIEIITSTVSLAEVAFAEEERSNGALDPNIEVAIDDMFSDREVVKLVEFHELVAREARSRMRQAITNGWRLKPMDAIHLATAFHLDATQFHTYDKPLLKYQAPVGFPINEPVTLRPRLPEPPTTLPVDGQGPSESPHG